MNTNTPPIGNMTYKSDLGFMTYNTSGVAAGLPGGVITVQGQTPPMPHAVIQAGSNRYTYDLNGNMLSAPNKLMTYDVENRLVSVETSTKTTLFTYDTDGSRIKKSSLRGTEGAEAISTTYISSLFEKDSNGETRKHIFAGANRVASITTNAVIPAQAGIHYYHSDHLGSSNVITNEQGAQVSFTEYTPYGTVATSTGAYNTPYKFTGKELDNTGLYFYAWRYYDPTIGRYCQPDTIIPEPYNPQTLNRYSYCDNNPLNYTDPSGHFAWFAFFAVVAKIAAAISIGSAVAGLISMAAGNQRLANTFFQISKISGYVAIAASIFSFITTPAQAASAGASTSPASEATSNASSPSAVSGSTRQAQAAAASDSAVKQAQNVIAENISQGGGEFDTTVRTSRALIEKGIEPVLNEDPLKYTLDTFSLEQDIYGKNLYAMREIDFSAIKFTTTSMIGDNATISVDSITASFGGGTSLSNGSLGISAELSAQVVEVSSEIYLGTIYDTTFTLHQAAGWGARAHASALITQSGGKIGVGGGLGPNADIELRFKKLK